ncbi:MAG: biopolymer transporter ExbD [Planctomycetota bacterium]
MRRRLVQPASETPRVNVTPMIDVVMVLIIFFLIVGRLAAEKRAPVDLPSADFGADGALATPMVVNVLAPDGRVDIGGRAFVVGEVTLLAEDRVADEPDLVVQLRADRSLAFDAVRPVLDALRAGGVESIQLAAREGGRP